MTEKILIVGGGLTGLTAALTLARSPARPQVTVLEGGATLGGLAGGFPLCGTSLEKSYHYLLMGDSAVLTLARELGLGDELIYRPGSVGIFDGACIHPFSTPLDLLRFAPCSLVDRIRLGFVMWRLQRLADWRPLVPQTARAWLERACGPGVMRTIWDPLLRGKFDRYSDQVSMAWLWARIHTRANSRAGTREKLAYFRGGFATLVNKMEAELLNTGVRLRTDARVQSIAVLPERRVLLANGEALDFDRCVFTGPSNVFAGLLPDDPALAAYRRQLQSITYLSAVCVILVTDQDLGRHHWVNIHDTAAPFLVLVNHTALVGTGMYQGKHVYYLGCYRPHDSPWLAMNDAPLLDAWLTYLRRMFPEFDRARLQEHHIFRFRNAQHVVDCDYEQKIPGFRTPLPRVYLGNFSQIFPHDRGTNYAVRDGQQLADLVLEDLRAAATS